VFSLEVSRSYQLAVPFDVQCCALFPGCMQTLPCCFQGKDSVPGSCDCAGDTSDEMVIAVAAVTVGYSSASASAHLETPVKGYGRDSDSD